MKVDADLRSAIKAVADDRRRARYEYDAKREAIKRSVSALIKSLPAAGDAVKEAKARFSKHLKLAASPESQKSAILKKYGIIWGAT